MRVYLGLLGSYKDLRDRLGDPYGRYPLCPGVWFMGRSAWEVLEELGIGDWEFDSVLQLAPVNSPFFNPGPSLAGGENIVNYQGNGNEYLVIRERVIPWIPDPEAEPVFEPRPERRPLRAIMAP